MAHDKNTSDSRQGDRNRNNDYNDADARRDPAQTHDMKGEAQNVNDDTGRPLNEQDLNKARNKANEGLRQERQNS
jgi:hypothetical protein